MEHIFRGFSSHFSPFSPQAICICLPVIFPVCKIPAFFGPGKPIPDAPDGNDPLAHFQFLHRLLQPGQIYLQSVFVDKFRGSPQSPAEFFFFRRFSPVQEEDLQQTPLIFREDDRLIVNIQSLGMPIQKKIRSREEMTAAFIAAQQI